MLHLHICNEADKNVALGIVMSAPAGSGLNPDDRLVAEDGITVFLNEKLYFEACILILVRCVNCS